ncbi:FHA domain-containing protein [Roseobacter sp.]|uniref:FHA domain-containing protein n=1 Tax=Roseobacter sp. TaxID=1907202 RepID=UPI0032976F83
MTLFRKVFHSDATPAVADESTPDAATRIVASDPAHADVPSGSVGPTAPTPEPDATGANITAAQPSAQLLAMQCSPDIAPQPDQTSQEDTAQTPFADEPAQPMIGGPQPAQPPQAATDIAAFAQHQLALSGHAPEPGGQGAVPAPLVGRAGRGAGRVRTRLLGFNRPDDTPLDPITAAHAAPKDQPDDMFPVGWLAIVAGPGTGHAFGISTGVSVIGRGEDQCVRLDFGDTSISRDTHASVAYDHEDQRFYIGHGGKSNIIRRNGRPVLSTEELTHGDVIRIGETTLRFVALCGADFQWDMSGGSDGGTL